VLPVTTDGSLRREDVRLWDQDHLNLYTVRSQVWRVPENNSLAADEAQTAVFGIRKLEIRGARMLLNGEPIRMGGANRHADHPRFGSIEPPEVVEADMRQMKAANMEFSRIIHYPVAEALLDWADRNGYLIIEEGPNWQLAPEQMDSAAIRAKFQSQTREMIERDWNHPAIVAWSVGNEYLSYTPSGLRWTKDMMDWVRTVDPSHFVTFASCWARSDKFDKPDGEGSYYSDFVCANIYEPDAAARELDLIHSRWPGKPVFISEFGRLADAVASEEDRQEYMRRMVAIFRARPFVFGASVWTIADYRSRWPGGTGTASDGLRHFGVVTFDRQPRGAYRTLASEFSPAVIADARVAVDSSSGGAIVASSVIRVRADFPAYTLRDYTVRYHLLDQAGGTIETKTSVLPVLSPGSRCPVELRFDQPLSRRAVGLRIEVVRPTGFVMTTTSVPM
jgi:beta-glucuronidase